MTSDGARSLAVFIDFENLALGFQGRRDRFDIARVLERLVEKGKIVVKKAYCDWSRFGMYTAPLHECAIELIEIPRRSMSGKNSADIRLCVDAMDLAYSKEHIDTFVIVSGDSDFSPLVSKLKELGKHVLGLGMQESTSELLRDNCDEFIYYEDLGRAAVAAPAINPQLPETKRKGFALLMESMVALRRENKEVLWSSMIKDTMKRKKPSFNESYHGYRSFSELLEDAEKEGLLELDTDKRSRTYVVTRFGSEMTSSAPAPRTQENGGEVRKRRRSSSRRRGSSAGGERVSRPAGEEESVRSREPAPREPEDREEPRRVREPVRREGEEPREPRRVREPVQREGEEPREPRRVREPVRREAEEREEPREPRRPREAAPREPEERDEPREPSRRRDDISDSDILFSAE